MDQEIIFPICCGIDVHKTYLVACIATTDETGVTTYSAKRRFSTYTKELRLLSDWIAQNNCKDVCIESCGKYWHPVFNVLEQTCKVVLSHPKYVKSIYGKKTDKRDAKRIAYLFKLGIVEPSFIPPFDIRQLRDLARYDVKLTSVNTGEKNRAQNCLTVSNYKLDDVFSDVFGKSSSAIIDQLLLQPDGKFDVTPFIDGRCKATADKVQDAVDGFICAPQAEKLKIILNNVRNVEESKAKLNAVIQSLAEPYNPVLEFITTVPGLKRPSAITVISEIGVDMSVFPTVKNLNSWAGLVPQNNESGGKKKTTRISRAGAFLKPALVQCALTVCNSQKHPEIRNRYLALKKRRGHKKAIIAIARMLLTACYYVIKKREPYNPELYKKPANPLHDRPLTLQQVAVYAKRHGCHIIDSDGTLVVA